MTESIFNPREQLAAEFRSNRADHTNKEPDWNGLLAGETNGIEKMKIRAARDAYQASKREQAFEAQQKEFDNSVSAVLGLRQETRNKTFYDDLKKNSGSLYHDVRVQRQMKMDRGVLGLRFHMRVK